MGPRCTPDVPIGNDNYVVYELQSMCYSINMIRTTYLVDMKFKPENGGNTRSFACEEIRTNCGTIILLLIDKTMQTFIAAQVERLIIDLIP